MQDVDISGVTPVQLILLMVFVIVIFSALSWGVLEAFRKNFKRFWLLLLVGAILAVVFYFAMQATM